MKDINCTKRGRWKYRVQVFDDKGGMVAEDWADTWTEIMVVMMIKCTEYTERGGVVWQMTQVDVSVPHHRILPEGQNKAQNYRRKHDLTSLSQARRLMIQRGDG